MQLQLMILVIPKFQKKRILCGNKVMVFMTFGRREASEFPHRRK
jgi:hypothetical protein